MLESKNYQPRSEVIEVIEWKCFFSKKHLPIMRHLIILMITSFSVAFSQDVTEEARRYYFRGQAATEIAKTAEDYQSAISEYRKAAQISPAWPDVYYALGQAQEKATLYADAIKSYKKYLELSPNSTNAGNVQGTIYKLEYKAEAEVKKTYIIDALTSGSGKWYQVFYYTSSIAFRKSDQGLRLDLLQDKYTGYSQRDIPVEFDGKTLKFSYSEYWCLEVRPQDWDAWPCEHKCSFTGTVVATNPLVLDVTIVDKMMYEEKFIETIKKQVVLDR